MILDMHILHIWTIKEHELRKYRKVLTIFKGSRCHVEIAFLKKLSTTQNNDNVHTRQADIRKIHFELYR